MPGRPSVRFATPSRDHRSLDGGQQWLACKGARYRTSRSLSWLRHTACSPAISLGMSIKGIVPGKAYRAYRFPHRSGGRLSRRASAVRPVGTFAGLLTAVLLAGVAFVGVAAAATVGYFASDLPAAHDLATVPIPLATHVYDRTGEHLLYTLADERRELIGLEAVPERMQQATIAIEDKT